MNAAVAETVQVAIDRRKFLGGSDIAALLGIAPQTWNRNSPFALWLDKTETPKADTQGLQFKRRGKRWESVVAEMLVESLEQRGHEVEIVGSNQRYIDPDFDFFACEIDFEIILDGETEITNVELKTVHPFRAAEWGEEGTDESPVWYTAQGVWGLGITRRHRCIIAPLFGADEIRTYPLIVAPDLLADIRETARKFWTEHVIPRVPPPPGGLVDLAKLFPHDCGQTLELGENLKFVDAIAELREADAAWRAVEERWNAAEFTAKEVMGDAAIATIGGLKACTWKTQGQTKVDVTRLRAERPDIAAAFESRVEFRKFLLTRPKEK